MQGSAPSMICRDKGPCIEHHILVAHVCQFDLASAAEIVLTHLKEDIILDLAGIMLINALNGSLGCMIQDTVEHAQ